MGHYRIRAPRYPHAAAFELDERSASFRAGAPITGRLHITAGDGPLPRALSVELQVVARGEVSSVGVAAEAVFLVDLWEPGRTYPYPFAFAAPCLPPPFSGRLFRTETRLAAVLDMPDHTAPLEKPVARAYPAAVHPIAVHADGPLVVRMPRLSHPGARTVRIRKGTQLLIGASLLLFGLASCALGIGLPFLLDVGAGVIVTLCAVALPFLLVGYFFVQGAYGKWRAERRMGVPEWTLEPREHPNGNTLSVTAQVPPPGDIERVTLRLRVEEKISRPAGDANSWGRSEDVAEARYDLAAAKGGFFAIDIPTTDLERAPPTLGLYGDSVTWEAEIAIQPRGAPIWKETAQLVAYRGAPPKVGVSFSFD